MQIDRGDVGAIVAASPVSTSADEFVIQLALSKGVLREEQMVAARANAAAQAHLASSGPASLLDVLESSGALSAGAIATLIGEEFGVERVEPSLINPTAEVLSLIPLELARRYHALPVERCGQTIRIALADPFDTGALDSLAHVSKHAIEALIAPKDEIQTALDRFYGQASRQETADNRGELRQRASNQESTEGAQRHSAIAAEDSDAPIIRIVHAIIHEAVRRRASDIHLEPLERRFRVRYRVDGVLVESDGPPKRLQLPVVSRVKIMANISIAEKRVPQDGRIQLSVNGRSLDLRVSTLPTAHGESVVMRILDQAGVKLGLQELGFASDDCSSFERLVQSPDGMILVTGPTGSGKTTTLYSCLHHLNQRDRKIITVEDPVEYQLDGINQVPVRHDIGMTFASALRAMLRQAPNIVMVGEIRDRETADIATNASLTGHLVFSTLHTNDAPGAVTRLADLGVKRFLISTSLRAVLAQRLVRKICEKCRQVHRPERHELRALGGPLADLGRAEFARGAGCVACNGTGYRGRTGIFEILGVDEVLQQLIYDGATTARLRRSARERGMRTMREDGVRKAIAGLTTLEEVVSITVGDAS